MFLVCWLAPRRRRDKAGRTPVLACIFFVEPRRRDVFEVQGDFALERFAAAIGVDGLAFNHACQLDMTVAITLASSSAPVAAGASPVGNR